MKRYLVFILGIIYSSNINAQAIWGTSGLLHMPTADMQKDKTFMVGGNILNKNIMPARWNNNDYTHTYNYYINITFFPWLEIAYTCTLVKGRKADGSYWPEYTWGKFVNQDRNFSARLRLWKEGWWKNWTPQIVVGSNDPGSFNHFGGGKISFDKNGQTSHHFNRYYIAATKHIELVGIGNLGVHAAYCYSIKESTLKYNGLAIGANFKFCLIEDIIWKKVLNGFDFMAEYDTRHVNVGFNYAMWKERINLITELNDGKFISGGVCLKICLK